MLSTSNSITQGLSPLRRTLPLVHGIARASISGRTVQYCTYRPNRISHNTLLRTPSLLQTTSGVHNVLSPLLYTPIRFYSSNNTEKPNTELEKVAPGGFSSSLKKWETKGKKIIKHYWLGTKLLYSNIGITFQLVKSLIKGHTLSRRERKLLVQTSADIFRLIPFIIIVIIPFMELALPILLRFFPNLLPSTYEWKDKKDEDRAKRLRANVEMAKFLQETMGELSLDLKKINAINADEFIEFMKKVKRGDKVTNKEIVTFSRLFEDEITLDKVSREQLIAMHNYLHGKSMNAIKWLSTEYLRTRISNKIEKIKQDDVLIHKEGLDALTLDELVDASLVRGMKVEGLHRGAIVKQLTSWLDLSLNQNVPPALLILSRAFMMNRLEPAEEALEDTLAHIPQEALEEVVRELPADGEERTKERLEELAKERAMIDKKKKDEAAKKAAEAKEAKETKKPAETKKVEPTESIKPKEGEEKEGDEEAAIKEIKKLDTDVEEMKQQNKKIIEEIGHAQGEPEAKSPKVLAKKLVGMIQGLEQEIDKIEKEAEVKVKEKKDKTEKGDLKEEKETKEVKDTQPEKTDKPENPPPTGPPKV